VDEFGEDGYASGTVGESLGTVDVASWQATSAA